MAMDYESVSKEIINGVGGLSNIVSATHCMTRLRLVLADESKADDHAVESIRGVKSVIKSGGQYQVVIGNEVSNLFRHFSKLGTFGDAAAPAQEKGNVFQRLIGFLAGCMTPLLPAMLGCGMLKVVLTVLNQFFHLSETSASYQILFAFADAFFLFLPIFLGYTIAKKLGGSPLLFMAVGAALCYPTLLGEPTGTFLGMPSVTLFGLPIIIATYTSSVLPMLLMAPVMKWAEWVGDRYSPNVLKAFLKPLIFLVICIPVVMFVLGPIGYAVGNALSGVFSAMYNAVPWLTVGLLSALMPFFVMSGMHYALIPLCIQNINTLGYDVIVLITMFCSNLAQGGAALGVAFRTKDTETKSEGIASGISALVAGVTEPALYGINLRFVRPLIAAVIAAGVGGLFCGFTGVKGYTMGGSPSLLSLVTFIGKQNPTHSLIFGAIAAVIVIGLSAVLAYILFRDPKVEETTPKQGHITIVSPLKGEVKPLSGLEDEAFSSGAMGQGMAIEPTEGKLYAPCDGEIVTFFPTGHAIGMRSDAGVELLIHVGMDTVQMDGEGFKPRAKQGDKVKRGTLLLEFDIAKIKAAGHSAATPVIVTNGEDFADLRLREPGAVSPGDELIGIQGGE